ncbi:MAG: hypothetical protein J6S14_02205 [Clostridia bacterium]|nr:hypothetical protein [Clostridia bacterium]
MTLIDLYNRTYDNCVFFKDKGNDAALLNEIGVLRGIVYCMEAVLGEENVHLAGDFAGWVKEQQRLKEELSKS